MTSLIIYHNNCYDGFCAFWVAHKALDTGNGGGYWTSSYGDPAPPDEMIKGNDVYILDFSYPKDTLIHMHSLANKLVVLDHHKTAQANCEGLDFCTFDMNRSGAGLTWDYFYPERPYPNLVKYIQDRDLWRFEHVDSRAVHAYIESYERSLEKYDQLKVELDHNLERAIIAGNAILRFQTQKVREICKEARFMEVGEYNVPVVNCPYNFGSLCGEYLCKTYPDSPFAAYYLDRGDGEQQWGLRSQGFDVSEVAKKLGGGGHKQASGFVKGKVSR